MAESQVSPEVHEVNGSTRSTEGCSGAEIEKRDSPAMARQPAVLSSGGILYGLKYSSKALSWARDTDL